MWWYTVTHGRGSDGDWRMQCVASTLHTTSKHGASNITTADAHTSAANSRLNWRPRRFKWTRPFRRKTKSDFCVCAITFQTQSTLNEQDGMVLSGFLWHMTRGGLMYKGQWHFDFPEIPGNFWIGSRRNNFPRFRLLLGVTSTLRLKPFVSWSFAMINDTHQRVGVFYFYPLQSVSPYGVIIVIIVRTSNILFSTSLHAVMTCSFVSWLNLAVISRINSTNF